MSEEVYKLDEVLMQKRIEISTMETKMLARKIYLGIEVAKCVIRLVLVPIKWIWFGLSTKTIYKPYSNKCGYGSSFKYG